MASRPQLGFYIFGLLAGGLIGGVSMLPFFAFTGALFAEAHVKGDLGTLFCLYGIALALGVFGLWLTTRSANFVAGFVTGFAFGLFGLTAVCNSDLAQLSRAYHTPL